MNERMRRQKQGAALLLALLVGYFGVAIGWQFAIGIDKGYGTGFTNRGYVPERIAREAGLEPGVDNEVLAKATNVSSHSGAFNEIWRIGVSLILLVAITSFYFLLASRVGTF